MIQYYDNATIEIRLREPLEYEKISGVASVFTEDDCLIIVTQNNKKYIYNKIYIMSIMQLDEEVDKEEVKLKFAAKQELARRELQRRRIKKIMEKLNGNELNELEIYLLNEAKEV